MLINAETFRIRFTICIILKLKHYFSHEYTNKLFFYSCIRGQYIGLTICIILELKHFFSHEYTNEIFIREFVAKNFGHKKAPGISGAFSFLFKLVLYRTELGSQIAELFHRSLLVSILLISRYRISQHRKTPLQNHR